MVWGEEGRGGERRGEVIVVGERGEDRGGGSSWELVVIRSVSETVFSTNCKYIQQLNACIS